MRERLRAPRDIPHIRSNNQVVTRFLRFFMPHMSEKTRRRLLGRKVMAPKDLRFGVAQPPLVSFLIQAFGQFHMGSVRGFWPSIKVCPMSLYKRMD